MVVDVWRGEACSFGSARFQLGKNPIVARLPKTGNCGISQLRR
jgi:hypothetical protein